MAGFQSQIDKLKQENDKNAQIISMYNSILKIHGEFIQQNLNQDVIDTLDQRLKCTFVKHQGGIRGNQNYQLAEPNHNSLVNMQGNTHLVQANQFYTGLNEMNYKSNNYTSNVLSS